MVQKGLVSVIIINWNGLEHLKKCLPSLYGQNYKNIEVVVVDNGSVDDSVSWLNSRYPKVKIVENKINLGFAPANNQGYLLAKGEFVLFLNNDTLVTKTFLIELLKILSSEKSIAAVQSKLLLMDSPTRLDSVGSFLTNTGFLYHLGVYAEDDPQYDKAMEVYSAKGACMLFKKEVLEKVKIGREVFDDRFFAYFEETDLCHRVWITGYKIRYVPSSVIYHKFGATSTKLLKPFVEYHSYKNRINSYIKNLSPIWLVKIFLPHILICEFLSVLFLFKGKFAMSTAIQKAIFWNLTNLKETFKKRKFIQTKIRKVKDDIILPSLMRKPKLNFYLSQLRGWNVDQTKSINAKKK